MKHLLTSISFILVCVFLLGGCQRKMEYADLMRHPDALEKAVVDCQSETSAYCDEVERARQDFNALVSERIGGPELFGQKIMQAQQLLGQLRQRYEQTAQGSDPAKWQASERAYREQDDKIKVLYAVVVATGEGGAVGK